MTTPTVAPTYKRDTGPVQRATGFATFATAATDAATLPSVGDAVSTLASGVLTLQLGFDPISFKMVNLTNGIIAEWFAPMVGTSCISTDTGGVRTLNTSSKAVVTVASRAGAVGGTSSGGTADSSPAGTVVITLSGFATNGDSLYWIAKG